MGCFVCAVSEIFHIVSIHNCKVIYITFERSECWNSSLIIPLLLEFLIDNTCTFVSFGGQVFQQSVGIPMGTNWAPLLADLFLYSYWAEFIQKLLLSINNDQFHLYVDSIYPYELEIKDTTECSTSASYFRCIIEIGHWQQINESAL